MHRQGWFGIAVWMTLGLILEGLIGWRNPAYLESAWKRELCRLAHAHGTLFSLILVAVSVASKSETIKPSVSAVYALRIGSILMPAAFLAATWGSTETDPGWAIWLAPVGGLLMIYGVAAAAFSARD
jgi:hypothetical protein